VTPEACVGGPIALVKNGEPTRQEGHRRPFA
jgi:dihydroxyacid dehydratase/phosphogluconate dehydratase